MLSLPCHAHHLCLAVPGGLDRLVPLLALCVVQCETIATFRDRCLTPDPLRAVDSGITLLTFSRLAGAALGHRFLPRSAALFWIGAVLLLAGLLFSVAARRHLGGNWSSRVTVKQDHTLTRSGPYRLVRHPIYTGLLLAVLGNAIALGEWRGLVALALFCAAFLRKIQIEERFMLEQFGDAYMRYRKEVAALVPGLL